MTRSEDPQGSESAGGAELLVVVADLHVSTGAGARLFDADHAFAGFAEYVGARTPQVSTLVLAGDFFDLLHVTRSGRAWRDTSEEASLTKLELAAAAHPIVLGALGDLAAAGVRIAVIPGNHDLELARPSAQRRFRELLGAQRTGAVDAVDFHPWIFHRPGFVYVEHGSQHHDLNAVRTLLAPSPDRLEIPLGAHLELYRLDAAAGARTKAHLRLAAALASRLLALGDARSRRARARYREEVLERLAAELGLDRRTLLALDGLAPLTPLAVERRALRELAVEPLMGRLGHAPRPRVGYLERAAAAVDDVLRSERAGVPSYVFGHAHVPADRPLRPGDDAPRYLNPGTWSTALPVALRGVGDRARFGFIELERPGHGEPTARLLRWDERRGAEPV